jgi:Tfp pilus assembly protein PilN
MIKINLLGVAPPPTAEAPPAPASLTFQLTVGVGSLVVCFAIVGLFYKTLSGAVTDLQAQLQRERAEQARLAAIKAENERYQLQLRELEVRINTIQLLQASRVGPVEHMTALGDMVNRASELYLYSVAPQGDRTVLRGQSGSVESMAKFLASLKASGYFDDVQLRQFYQDDQETRLTYKFALDYIFKSQAVAATAPPGAPAGAATRGRRAGL